MKNPELDALREDVRAEVNGLKTTIRETLDRYIARILFLEKEMTRITGRAPYATIISMGLIENEDGDWVEQPIQEDATLIRVDETGLAKWSDGAKTNIRENQDVLHPLPELEEGETIEGADELTDDPPASPPPAEVLHTALQGIIPTKPEVQIADPACPYPSPRFKDMGTYWHDTEAKPVPIFDTRGNMIGSTVHSHIPKPKK